MSTVEKVTTAAELMRLPRGRSRYELIKGMIRDWLAAGTKLAWVIYPKGRTVTVYRSLDDIHVLSEQDSLSGEDVVPGFACKIADLFPAAK